jgi:hypothetical protein
VNRSADAVEGACRKVQDWVHPNRKSTSKAGRDGRGGFPPKSLPVRSAFAFLQFGVRLGAVVAPVVLTISQARKAATDNFRCGFQIQTKGCNVTRFDLVEIEALKWLRHATGETTIAPAKAEFLWRTRRPARKMTVATGETTIAKAGWFFCFSSLCRNRSTQFQEPMNHLPNDKPNSI